MVTFKLSLMPTLCLRALKLTLFLFTVCEHMIDHTAWERQRDTQRCNLFAVAMVSGSLQERACPAEKCPISPPSG